MTTYRRSLMAILMLGALAMPALAAERMYGAVVTVDPAMNFLSLTREDVRLADPDARILIDNRTKFVGLDSLNDLRYGDELLVSGDMDVETKTWVAYILRRVELEDTSSSEPPTRLNQYDIEESKRLYLNRDVAPAADAAPSKTASNAEEAPVMPNASEVISAHSTIE